MTPTSPDTSKAATPQCWYQSTCPWFASAPPPHLRVTQGGYSGAAWPPTGSNLRLAATSSAFGRPARRSHFLAPDIEVGMVSEDWDLLFRAVLETLARVASGSVLPHSTAMRLQTQEDVFRGCIEALDQMRTAIPVFPGQLIPTRNDSTVFETA